MNSSQACLILLLVLACWRGCVVLFGFSFSAHFVCSNLSSTLINRNKAVRVNLPHISSCIQSLGLQFVCSLLNIKPHLDLSLVIVSMHSHHIEQSILPRGNNFVDYTSTPLPMFSWIGWIYLLMMMMTILDCNKRLLYIWFYSRRVLSIHTDPYQALKTFTEKQTKNNYRKWKWKLQIGAQQSKLLILAFSAINVKS